MPPPHSRCEQGFVWLALGGDDYVCEGGNHSYRGRDNQKTRFYSEVRRLRSRLKHADPQEALRISSKYHRRRDEWRRRRFEAVRNHEVEENGGRLSRNMMETIDEVEQKAAMFDRERFLRVNKICFCEEELAKSRGEPLPYFDEEGLKRSDQVDDARKHADERNAKQRAEEEDVAYRLAFRAKLKLEDEENQHAIEERERRDLINEDRRRREETEAGQSARSDRR